jgi:hypothetical protein
MTKLTYTKYGNIPDSLKREAKKTPTGEYEVFVTSQKQFNLHAEKLKSYILHEEVRKVTKADASIRLKENAERGVVNALKESFSLDERGNLKPLVGLSVRDLIKNDVIHNEPYLFDLPQAKQSQIDTTGMTADELWQHANRER